MSYYVCLGEKERYGNMALGGSTHTYKDFRFRDPLCPDTGRTKEVVANFIDPEMVMLVTSKTSEDYHKGAEGLVWKIHGGTKPSDHQFTRTPNNKIIDHRIDTQGFGSRTSPKKNPPDPAVNEGFIIGSSWKSLKEKGLLK